MTSARTRWIGLACLALGLAMIIVDTSIVNVAVPRIITDLKITPSAAEWVNSSYALVFAAALITLSRIGDIIGQRRLYMIGTSVFAGASVLAALAPSGELLIGARLLQGLGGAAMAPSTQAIVNATFRGKDRAIAFAIYGSVIGGMAALGPVIGGWLTTNASWRLAFGVNLPIATVAILGTLATVAETRREAMRRGFDVLGVLFITIGLGGIVFGLIEGYSYGWWAPSTSFAADPAWAWWPTDAISAVPVAFLIGALALLAFLLYERARLRAGRPVLIDFTLFAIPTFRYGNLAGTIVSLGEFGILFALPLFLAAVQQYSAFETGLCFLPLALGVSTFTLIIAGLIVYTVFLVREMGITEQQDSFLNSVTHELKTPIASIRLYLETLQSRDVGDAQRKEFYKNMLQDADRLQHTVEQVLRAGVARQKRKLEHRGPVDLGWLTQECVDTARTRHHLADEAIVLTGNDLQSPIVVNGDIDDLRTAIANLLDNAVKYSGGVPQISVQIAGATPDTAWVRVKDQGIGIHGP